MNTRSTRRNQSVTNRDGCIVIIVTPRGEGRFDAMTLDGTPLVAGARAPLLDSARVLVARGGDPDAVLVMRHSGSDTVALRARLGAAAALTVDENRAVFARWKPFSHSAVRPPVGRRAGALLGQPPGAGAILGGRP